MCARAGSPPMRPRSAAPCTLALHPPALHRALGALRSALQIAQCRVDGLRNRLGITDEIGEGETQLGEKQLGLGFAGEIDTLGDPIVDLFERRGGELLLQHPYSSSTASVSTALRAA